MASDKKYMFIISQQFLHSSIFKPPVLHVGASETKAFEQLNNILEQNKKKGFYIIKENKSIQRLDDYHHYISETILSNNQIIYIERWLTWQRKPQLQKC